MKKLSTILLFLSFLCCSYAQEVRDAQFPGGDKALQQFFRESVDYTGSFKSRKDFCVVAELLIEEDGTAVFSKVIKPKNAKERVVRQVKRLIKYCCRQESGGSDHPIHPQLLSGRRKNRCMCEGCWHTGRIAYSGAAGYLFVLGDKG